MNISVIIPTYKRPENLIRLLESIACQTLLPKEVIVVDDCSYMDEQYSSVISMFSTRIEGLQFISLKENSGAPASRNVGIQRAKGEWIALVDDDDEWLPDKLNLQTLLIKNSSNHKLGFVYTWAHALGSNGQDSYDSNNTFKGNVAKKLLTTNFILSPSVLIKREALLAVGCFDESFPSCQDWDTWIRIALSGYEFDVVEKYLVIYHRHGGESIGLSSRAMFGYKLLLEKHWIEILKYTSPLNWIKKIILYSKVCLFKYE